MDTLDRQAYQTVIASKRWKDLRARLLRERGERCQRCHKHWAPGYKAKLQLHHTTYERLGHELDSDVELLCDFCHAHADVQRAIAGRDRSEAALYEARLDGWASKKYGEDWDDRMDADRIAAEFDAWLEDDDHDEW